MDEKNDPLIGLQSALDDFHAVRRTAELSNNQRLQKKAEGHVGSLEDVIRKVTNDLLTAVRGQKSKKPAQKTKPLEPAPAYGEDVLQAFAGIRGFAADVQMPLDRLLLALVEEMQMDGHAISEDELLRRARSGLKKGHAWKLGELISPTSTIELKRYSELQMFCDLSPEQLLQVTPERAFSTITGRVKPDTYSSYHWEYFLWELCKLGPSALSRIPEKELLQRFKNANPGLYKEYPDGSGGGHDFGNGMPIVKSTINRMYAAQRSPYHIETHEMFQLVEKKLDHAVAAGQ